MPGCGDNDDDDDIVCLPNGQLALSDTSLTFAAVQNDPPPSDQTLDVNFPAGVFPTGTVAGLVIGIPPGVFEPDWIDVFTFPPLADPQPVDVSILRTDLPLGTYTTIYRFLATDAVGNLLGCQDLSVIYNITS